MSTMSDVGPKPLGLARGGATGWGMRAQRAMRAKQTGRGGDGGWGGNDGEPFGGLPMPMAKAGLLVFMGVVTVLFSIIVSTYVARMAFVDWDPLPEPRLLWLNTAVLILSSGGMQWAWVATDRGQRASVQIGLLVGGVGAFLFLAGQLWAWQQLGALGYFVARNPANSFFYLITAAHGLHLLGGLVAWGRTSGKLWSGVGVRLSVQLCAWYWHFLLVVWLVLFALMLST
jgi:cytochrome c oxidase subunit 3